MQAAQIIADTVGPKNRPTVGFIISEVTSQVNSQIWRGAVEAAQALDVNLLGFAGYELERPDGFKAQGNILYDLISAENVAGLVLWTNSLSNFAGSDAARKLYERFPAVPMVELEYSTTLAENYSYRGIGTLIHHLIERHARRQIAFIRGPQGHQEAEHRYRAYCDALQTAQCPFDLKRVVLADDWFAPSGKKAISILLDQRQATFDAVVAANDLLAIGALQELQLRGIRVPTDVIVTGFDDILDAQYASPPLTTIRYPLYEMGWQAVEAVVAQITGQVFIRTPFPVQLQIRQSCGCLSQTVVRAAAENSFVTDEFEHAFTTQRSTLLPALQAISQETGIPFTFIEPLFDAFASEMRGNVPGMFIDVLSEMLKQTLTADGDVARWQDVISAFYHQSLPYLSERPMMVQAENIWQQSRILIGEMVTQVKMSQASQKEQQTAKLFEITGRLVTMFHVEGVMDILAEELPAIGIPACYLALYQNPSVPTDMARLMLAYSDQGRALLGADGLLFSSKRLVPTELLPQDRQYALLLYDLYFHNQQIGFILFEMSQQGRNAYEALCGAISSALQGALLVQHVQEHSAEIARQKYVLDTFMANIPDNIYFKDRESRFTKVNPALAQRFGVSEPEALVGKSDFDFFPETQARPKYEHEQQILHTGQAVLNLEEFDIGGSWSLTTKMPLRDEHGEIIGTFGISRDITPLKIAQQQVEEAYAEIQMLNEQLKQENLRMSAELDIARRLQQMVLPMPGELDSISGLDIVGYMQPAEEVGGDYYDVLPYQQGNVCIGIGDVTGHGLESGVLMLMTQTAIRALIDRGESDPVVFLNTINRVLFQNIQRMGVDRSLTLVMVNYQSGQLRLIGQHEEALVVRCDGSIERMDTIDLGFPLGMVDDISQWIAEATITLAPGDGLVLYTDGITEAQNAANSFYGLDRLCAVISATWREASAEIVKEAILNDLCAFVGGAQVYDDITLVVLKQK